MSNKLEFDNIVERDGLDGLRKYFPFIGPHDLSTVDMIEDKADGSLISTYMIFEAGAVALKSKGSLASVQAVDATQWLNRPENSSLLRELNELTSLGCTVNMEWCSPTNRIVLGYAEPSLRVLNIRNNLNGLYVERDIIDHFHYVEIYERWTKRIEVDNPVEFVASIPAMSGIEGFVIRLASGQRVKIKTLWYLALHHTKDSINSQRRLFEAVIEEASDDMKSLFHDDPVAIKLIVDMEEFVEKKFNHLVDSVERFYERNKHLDRKEFAILGQQELDGMQFGLAMQKYSGKSVDYKAFLKSKWKQLGLKDEMNADE